MRDMRIASFWFAAATACLMAAGPCFAQASGSPALRLELAGEPAIVFTPARDACDGDDVPDAPLRAFRDADGGVVAFGMHDVNRALRGPSVEALKLDCHVVLGSGQNGDPAAYDDHNWITATWTADGRTIEALVHHEYHAGEHPGRCRFEDFMSCWYNTITPYRSIDGGMNFSKDPAIRVVAAPPFRQQFEQGRHRGFFNPSNIIHQGDNFYFMASTTGWPGQEAGVCLFRNADPAEPDHWLAYDGKSFSRHFGDPYAAGFTTASSARPCRPIAPFPAPVGAIVQQRSTHLWLAVFQAEHDSTYFPVSGFYYASSRDLITWSLPRLLMAGPTLYDNACTSGGALIAYPSLIDPQASGRNFDDVGDSADFFYVTLAVDGCAITGRRDLVRRSVNILPAN